MTCPNCQNPLPQVAETCPYCGTNTMIPPGPEGFTYDPANGYYYQYVIQNDAQTGKPIQFVTYYFPETRSYTQASFPMQEEATESSPVPPQVEPQPVADMSPVIPPQDYLYDKESDFYYKSRDGLDAAGKPVKIVTYFDADTGEYIEVDYPMDAPVPGAYQSAPQILAPKRPHKKRGKIAALVAIFVLVLGVGGYFAASHFGLLPKTAQTDADERENSSHTSVDSTTAHVDETDDGEGYHLSVHNIQISANDSRTATVKLSNISIPSAIAVDQPDTPKMQMEACIIVSFVDGENRLFEVGSAYFTTDEDAQPHEISVEGFEHTVWLLKPETGNSDYFCDARVLAADSNSITWEITVPEGKSIDFSNITQLGFMVEFPNQDAEEFVFLQQSGKDWEVLENTSLPHYFISNNPPAPESSAPEEEASVESEQATQEQQAREQAELDKNKE